MIQNEFIIVGYVMSLIIWSDEYSIGVPDVDREHEQLIELINRLYNKFEEDSSETTVLEVLKEIHRDMSAHFSNEEKFMRERGYDQYVDHKSEHALLLDEIKEVMFYYEEISDFDKGALGEHLKKWFIVHFKTKDARLHNKLV